MKSSSYLIPDNPIALAIVIVLAVLFGIWLISLTIRWFILAKLRRQLEACADVSILRNAIRSRVSFEDVSKSNQPELLNFQDHANAAFKSFCDAKGLSPKSVIARHLRAIFDAGINESRLEVTPLVKNTGSYLLRSSNLFRSVLSLFIIIGLLGTLGGLASTLGQLSQISPEGDQGISTAQPPPNDQSGTQPIGSGQSAQDRAAKGLKTVLEQLKSAFAPSIWGVLYTIVGVLLFGLFLQVANTPLRDALERHTLVDWVPALLPTPSQSLWEKLQVSDRQIQASLESAKDVAQLAKSIQDDSSDLSKSIRDAKRSIPKLTKVSDQLVNFSDNFVNAVNVLIPFEQQLRQLYEQLLSESKTFHETVRENIAKGEVFQRGVATQLDSQNEQIVSLLIAFNAYEKAYIATRESIDEKLDRLLQEANKAYLSLGERNQEVITTIVSSLREPLSHDLTNGLSKVENALDVRLSTLSRTLEALHTPLEHAADGLEGTLQNLNTRTEILLKELQQEFFGRNKLHEQQLANITDLSGKLTKLLEQLSGSSSLLKEYEQVLGNNVNTLAQNVGTLGGNIDVLNQSLSSNGRGSQSEEELKRLLPLHEQLMVQLQSLVETLKRQRPTSVAVPPKPINVQPPPLVRESFIRRFGDTLFFWRR